MNDEFYIIRYQIVYQSDKRQLSSAYQSLLYIYIYMYIYVHVYGGNIYKYALCI